MPTSKRTPTPWPRSPPPNRHHTPEQAPDSPDLHGESPARRTHANSTERELVALSIRGIGVRVPGGPRVVCATSVDPFHGHRDARQHDHRPRLARAPGHTLGSVTRHFWSDVAVGVHGQRNLAMAEYLHNHPGGRTGKVQNAG